MQAQGVFQFFNKPNQKGHTSGQSTTAKQAEREHANANINEDWGNQQVCPTFGLSNPSTMTF